MSEPDTSHQRPPDTIAIRCACGFDGWAPIRQTSPGLRACDAGPQEPPTFVIRCPGCRKEYDPQDAQPVVEFLDEDEGDRMDERGDH